MIVRTDNHLSLQGMLSKTPDLPDSLLPLTCHSPGSSCSSLGRDREPSMDLFSFLHHLTGGLGLTKGVSKLSM